MGSLSAARPGKSVSYELPMALAIAAPLLLANSLSLREIVDNQGGYLFGFIPRWHVFQLPFPQIFGFILFLDLLVCRETNRIPFDLPEAENEPCGVVTTPNTAR